MLTEQVMSEKIGEFEAGILFSVLLSIIAIIVAWRSGFFRWPALQVPKIISGIDVSLAFVAFLIMQLIIAPAAFLVLYTSIQGHPIDLLFALQEPATLGWFNLFSIMFGAAGVGIAFMSLGPVKRKSVTGIKGFVPTDIWMGIATWLVGYPLAMLVSQIVALFFLIQFHYVAVDQVAVKNLKVLLSQPLLFTLTLIAVVVIIPIVEETLFRGYLQSWFSTIISRRNAIIGTSIIFSSFHYSGSQGLANFEVISALFVLSCFLGFIYERQQNLWSSITLHSFFNGISAMIILMTN